jgi:UDP-glucuronate 4-epimerase
MVRRPFQKLINKAVLLTGGAGFIGSHLAEALVTIGARLAIVDNLDDFYSSSLKRSNLRSIQQRGPVEFYETDICDWTALRSVVDKFRPEIVIHLAACAGVRPSIQDPRLYERVNIGGTFNLLELCREFHVTRFLFGSSSSVYGATNRAPFVEDEVEMRPLSPYAATKLAGEMVAYTYANLFGLEVVCLRFFTVYGPRQRPDLAIHKFTALIEARRAIPIFGDGSSGRDYTYIDDIVSGILAAVTYDYDEHSRIRFDVFNLGNSKPIKLLELVESLEVATGQRALRDYKPVQPGDMILTWADLSKAARSLGYKPSVPFAEGLRRFVTWYRATDASHKLSFP